MPSHGRTSAAVASAVWRASVMLVGAAALACSPSDATIGLPLGPRPVTAPPTTVMTVSALGDVAVLDVPGNLWTRRGDSIRAIVIGPATSVQAVRWSSAQGAFAVVRTDAVSHPTLELWDTLGVRTQRLVLDSIAVPFSGAQTTVTGPAQFVGLASRRLAWTATYFGGGRYSDYLAVLDSGSTSVRFFPSVRAAPCLVPDGSASGLLLVGPDSSAGDLAPVNAIREFDAATGATGGRFVLPVATFSCPRIAATRDAILMELGGQVTRIDRATMAISWQLDARYSGPFALSPDGSRLVIGSLADLVFGIARVLIVDQAGVIQQNLAFGGLTNRTVGPERVSGVDAMAWSADGRAVLASARVANPYEPQFTSSVRRLDAVTGVELAKVAPTSNSFALSLIERR